MEKCDFTSLFMMISIFHAFLSKRPFLELGHDCKNPRQQNKARSTSVAPGMGGAESARLHPAEGRLPEGNGVPPHLFRIPFLLLFLHFLLLFFLSCFPLSSVRRTLQGTDKSASIKREIYKNRTEVTQSIYLRIVIIDQCDMARNL